MNKYKNKPKNGLYSKELDSVNRVLIIIEITRKRTTLTFFENERGYANYCTGSLVVDNVRVI